ncbi:hypothetical protein M569_11764 [Genlisea aurea]|uniref:RRM domain-containing protein n=1 Tax=Genlisea aurea TaxID=192259 RepID=S8DT79_9LAMI|nr:hypothetical protein M569_11764 [Genlisea aurea]
MGVEEGGGVGNIPYDATEEQIVQICEEVGPVVSFRLVVDRETGKPKGYGFCEYKDEETALSARRNLQGYEINGRHLRVDFAENDKGRVPGSVNADPVKQSTSSSSSAAPLVNQPMGDSVAAAAAAVMAKALLSPQRAAVSRNQSWVQSSESSSSDPLTRHLAGMSKAQLAEIMSEFKAMAKRNEEEARQLLLAIPNLAKALFQAEIMLGMVSSQMLQRPNIRQTLLPQSVSSSSGFSHRSIQVPAAATSSMGYDAVRMIGNSSDDYFDRAAKSTKLNDGRAAAQSVDSAVLQQVMSLTAEQLRSLPPDQQQQVILLQQMLRHVT